MRAYAIIQMAGGQPDLPIGATVKGYVLGASANGWGLYLIGGTMAQIAAVDALPDTVAICTVAQVDDIISAGKRAELDTWADTNFPSLPPVPANWTNEQVIIELFTRADANYVHAGLWLKWIGLGEAQAHQTLAIAPNPPNVGVVLNGEAWKLIDIGDYGLWQVDSDEDNLIAIHQALYDGQQPQNTLGLIAVVNEFGVSFRTNAVMNTFDHPAAELLARRDRIAGYLEGIGFGDTIALRTATNEHQQIAGIVMALGYNLNQLWNAMHQ